VTISLTRSRITGQVSAPRLVTRPSAIVFGAVCGTSVPPAFERAASSAPSGSAPKIARPGRSAVAAIAQPEISPPPPTGATSASRSGTSSSSSSAAVPCPAITSAWS
jgi:hypothetical protein